MFKHISDNVLSSNLPVPLKIPSVQLFQRKWTQICLFVYVKGSVSLKTQYPASVTETHTKQVSSRAVPPESRQTTLRTLSNSPSQTHSDFLTLFCRQMNNKQLLVIYATTLGNWVVRVRLDSLSQEAAIIK